MRLPSTFLRRLAVVAVTSILFFSPASFGQEEEAKGPFREPGITYREVQKPLLAWVAGMLIVVACLLVAAKNPHRSHLD